MMPCQVEGLTHTCPPVTPVLQTLSLGPDPTTLPASMYDPGK